MSTPTKYFEQYIPGDGQIYTNGGGDLTAGQQLKKAFFQVSDDADISFVTTGGDVVTDLPVLAGVQYDIEVTKITSLSTGTCYIRHNGETLNFPAETAPDTQAASITFSSVTATGMSVDWTDGNGVKRILVGKAGGAVDADPVNGTTYTPDTVFGDGSEIGTGNFVLAIREQFDGDPIAITGLDDDTEYHFRVFEYRGVAGSERYNTDTATGNPNDQITLAIEPATQASAIVFSNVAATTLDVTFTNGSGESRIIVCRSGGAVNATPSDLSTYADDGGNVFGDGSEIGTGNFVVGIGSGPFTITGLTTATTYHFRVFEFNGVAGNENYKTATATNNPRSQLTA